MKGRMGNDLAAILLAFSLNRKIFRFKRAGREIVGWSKNWGFPIRWVQETQMNFLANPINIYISFHINIYILNRIC